MADYSVKTEDQYGRQIKPVLFIPRSYQPLTDFFIDLRTHNAKTWNVDLRALMPNDGNDDVVIQWMIVNLTRPDVEHWTFAIADNESQRLIVYLHGSILNPTGAQAQIAMPVQAAPAMLPVRLDRPRNLQIYLTAPDTDERYVSAYGDIRLANQVYQNQATLAAGAKNTLGSYGAIQSNFCPWRSCDGTSTSVAEEFVATVDLGSIMSLKKIAAYWSWYIETAQDADARVRLAYSSNGVNYTSIRSYAGLDIPAGIANAEWENRSVSDVTARYLHMCANTGATGNKVHCMVATWFAWKAK